MRALQISLMLGLAGCGAAASGGAEGPPSSGGVEGGESQPTVTAEQADGALDTEPDTPADRMWHHFWEVVHARDAVVRGDIQRAKAALATIEAGDYGIETPQEWIQPLLEMQADAGRGVRASDLEGVARSVAAVGLHCGECHRRVADRSVMEEGDTRGYLAHGRVGVTEAMARHQWAMAELWLGLTSPRHADWIRGADALAEAWEPNPTTSPTEPTAEGTADAATTPDDPGAPAAPVVESPPVAPELAARIQAVRDEGAALRVAQTPHARAAALAGLFVRCASCHMAD